MTPYRVVLVDPVTQLPNYKALELHFEAFKATIFLSALLLIEVKFDENNNSALEDIARGLEKYLLDSDFVCRYTQNSFVVLLHNLSDELESAIQETYCIAMHLREKLGHFLPMQISATLMQNEKQKLADTIESAQDELKNSASTQNGIHIF